jgi:pyroglutamyl-peptidase
VAQSAGQAGDKTTPVRPVILLTGFEPFGEGRPPNPSWEAIKELDGREWRGYQLVCKQLPVVWGSPLEHLPGWVDQYHPVAIFSFGQGGPGFTIESKASVERNDYEDNRGERPRTRTIVKDGPNEFRASINCEKLVDLLSEKGYPIRVSTRAGRYLCEEALYSLEYMKSTKHLEATVLFCHVPPLISKIRGKEATVGYVHQFVKDMLEAWYTVYHTKTPTGTAEEANQGAKDPRYQEIKEFISRYFRTWSEQDMKGYDECFLPDACIQFIDSQDRLHTSARAGFVANQAEYHRTAPHKSVEVPEAMDIRFEAKLARAVVSWKLTAGPRTERGYDHFTLVKHEGKWRIINLTFYATSGADE